jgi:hypothetical protein
MSEIKSTSEFYAELRSQLQDNGQQEMPGLKVGGATMGVGKGSGVANTSGQSATSQTVLTRKQVDMAQARALQSLKELTKRNQEAERRAKATVHAMSAKYLQTLAKNPDVRDGDPLFFFGYGLECMEDIIYAGFCQVNTSVNLYLEEIDTRFNNLLVIAEEIDAALKKTKQLREDLKVEAGKIEIEQAQWLEKVKGTLQHQWSEFLAKLERAEKERLEEVKRSNRSVKKWVMVLTGLVALLGIAAIVLAIH